MGLVEEDEENVAEYTEWGHDQEDGHKGPKVAKSEDESLVVQCRPPPLRDCPRPRTIQKTPPPPEYAPANVIR